MTRAFAALFVALLLLSPGVCVKHVIVVMLENRSFDHYLGTRAGVDGLNSNNNWNPVNASNPALGIVRVGNATYVAPCDGDHSTPGTTSKIFPLSPDDATMMGFATEEAARGTRNFCSVMSAFEPAQLPVTSFLADNFAVFDRYFSSHPVRSRSCAKQLLR